MNAHELVEIEESPYQYIVCEECGMTHCQPGGWVDYRKSGNLVLLIPAFKTLREEYDVMGEEYYPPSYLREKGVGYISEDDYKTYFEDFPKFPSDENIPSLSGWEAAKIYQMEAPIRMLGEIFSNPTLKKDTIIASSEGNYLELIDVLVQLLEELPNNETCNLRPITSDERIITLYLDVPDFSEWKALTYTGEKYSLYLDPGYVFHTSRVL